MRRCIPPQGNFFNGLTAGAFYVELAVWALYLCMHWYFKLMWYVPITGAKLYRCKHCGNCPESGWFCELMWDHPVTGASTVGTLPGGLPVVPGPAGGEGCSAEGGCASCPYMKMNSLDALLGVCTKIGTARPSHPRPTSQHGQNTRASYGSPLVCLSAWCGRKLPCHSWRSHWDTLLSGRGVPIEF